MRSLVWAIAGALLILNGAVGAAQGLTGQISGTIVDPDKGVLPGATIIARNTATQASGTAVSDGRGEFVVTNLLAGTYEIQITLEGFKGYRQARDPARRRRARRLAGDHTRDRVGGRSGDGAGRSRPGADAERRAVGDDHGSAQIEDIGLRGRDFMGTLKLLPGVVDTSARDAPGWGSVGGMTINGQGAFNFSYDGVTNKDTGSNSGNYAAPALDSIAEVKVQASNFQAEYGRTSGATIVVVTKSGSSSSAGRRPTSGATRTSTRTPGIAPRAATRPTATATDRTARRRRYRYDNTAYTIGGPVLIPGTAFNRNRDKLFFFWSQDILPRNDPGGLQQQHDADGARAQRRFLADRRTASGQPQLDPGPALRQGLACNVNTGGAGLLRRQHHSRPTGSTRSAGRC